jgi:hypothetical protein
VVVVGYQDVDGLLTDCVRVGSVDNGHGLDNDEQGAPIRRCAGPAGSWRDAWPRLRHLG